MAGFIVVINSLADSSLHYLPNVITMEKGLHVCLHPHVSHPGSVFWLQMDQGHGIHGAITDVAQRRPPGFDLIPFAFPGHLHCHCQHIQHLQPVHHCMRCTNTSKMKCCPLANVHDLYLGDDLAVHHKMGRIARLQCCDCQSRSCARRLR